MKRNHLAGIGIIAVVLVLMTAGAAALITRENIKPESVPASSQTRMAREKISWNETRPAPPPQRAANCEDGNIAGKVIGGVAGGIAGSQVGKGSGKTAATIGGTLGGAYLGGEYIPTDNVTCR